MTIGRPKGSKNKSPSKIRNTNINKRKVCAERHIAIINATRPIIEELEKELKRQKAKITKSLGVLRPYKARGIVRKISKYEYEVIEK